MPCNCLCPKAVPTLPIGQRSSVLLQTMLHCNGWGLRKWKACFNVGQQLLQEFNFYIVYRKGVLNTNADALSRREQPTAEVTALTISLDWLKERQRSDPTITQVYNTIMAGSLVDNGDTHHFIDIRSYGHSYTLSMVLCVVSSAHMFTVPLLPPNLQPDALRQCHNEAIWDMKSHSINYTRKLIG